MNYRIVTAEELKTILSKHAEWLADNTKGERADLSYADLRSADLRYADLRSANLSSANLRYADLRSANLSSANLRYADLRSADLRSANLRYADLRSADLRSANLRYADLSYADLRYADLLIFQFNRNTAYYTKDGTLRIGCIVMPVTEWALGFREIGKSNSYSETEIKAYGQFIDICMDLFKEGK